MNNRKYVIAALDNNSFDAPIRYIRDLEISVPGREITGEFSRSKGTGLPERLPRFHKGLSEDVSSAIRFDEFSAKYLASLLRLVLRNGHNNFYAQELTEVASERHPVNCS